MKKIVTVTEVEGEGLVGLLGKRVLLLCANYFYSGVLAGVNTSDVLLEDAGIVYETGPLNAAKFQDEQKFAGPLYVRVASIESYREV
ncbi:MAG: hypothetical protein EBR82_07410 [Caulobacteraceae bacterium]|nr:hypothetical protein [Caulobacteraceae bacterium]